MNDVRKEYRVGQTDFSLHIYMIYRGCRNR